MENNVLLELAIEALKRAKSLDPKGIAYRGYLNDVRQVLEQLLSDVCPHCRGGGCPECFKTPSE